MHSKTNPALTNTHKSHLQASPSPDPTDPASGHWKHWKHWKALQWKSVPVTNPNNSLYVKNWTREPNKQEASGEDWQHRYRLEWATACLSLFIFLMKLLTFFFSSKHKVASILLWPWVTISLGHREARTDGIKYQHGLKANDTQTNWDTKTKTAFCNRIILIVTNMMCKMKLLWGILKSITNKMMLEPWSCLSVLNKHRVRMLLFLFFPS